MVKKKTEFSELIAPADFAKEIGITRQAICLAMKNGIIPVVMERGKKRINLVDPIVKEYAKNTRSVRQENAKSSKKTKLVNVTVKKNSKKKKSVEEGDTLPQDLKKIIDADGLTLEMVINLPKAWVEKIKIYEQYKQIKQKRTHDKRDLISRKLVRVFTGKLYEIDTNEFLQLKTKIVPDLASIMGCTDSEKMLAAEKRVDEELWKILKHIKIEIDKFLNKVDKEYG